MGPTTRARSVHSRRRAAEEYSDEDEQQQDASSSSSSDDDEEEDEVVVEGSGQVDDDGDEGDVEEALAAEPAARESPAAAAGRSGRKVPITINLKKVCKVCKKRGHEAGFKGAVYIDCPMKPCFLCKMPDLTILGKSPEKIDGRIQKRINLLATPSRYLSTSEGLAFLQEPHTFPSKEEEIAAGIQGSEGWNLGTNLDSPLPPLGAGGDARHHKRKLDEEYGTEPWTLEQKLGKTVFIPVSCAHQARNLKFCTKASAGLCSPLVREAEESLDNFLLTTGQNKII